MYNIIPHYELLFPVPNLSRQSVPTSHSYYAPRRTKGCVNSVVAASIVIIIIKTCVTPLPLTPLSLLRVPLAVGAYLYVYIQCTCIVIIMYTQNTTCTYVVCGIFDDRPFVRNTISLIFLSRVEKSRPTGNVKRRETNHAKCTPLESRPTAFVRTAAFEGEKRTPLLTHCDKLNDLGGP